MVELGVKRVGPRATVGILLLGLAFVAGCSGAGADRPDTVPVSGTVVYKGKPVEGATVSFMAEGAPKPATGITDAEGKFQLSTFEFNDGAVVGEHVITVEKYEQGAEAAQTTSSMEEAMNDPNALAEMAAQFEEEGEAAQAGPKSLLPPKYADPKTTPLKEKVTAEGPNTFVLQLTD